MHTVKNNIFMQKALDLAVRSAEGGTGPFGCVIVKNGHIIAEGWNQVTVNNDPSAHAEVEAIRKACKTLNAFQLTDCDVYTSSYPCPMCLGALYWARPRKIYYTNTPSEAAAIGFDDQFIYEEIAKANGSRKSYNLEHIEMDNALIAFSIWEKNTGKVLY